MRSVIVMDTSFAHRERTLLSRLEIGLADEGVRVAHAVPWTSAAAETVGLYSVTVGYVDRGLPFTLRQRARMLQEQLREAMSLDEDDRVEIVHVMGDGFRHGWSGGTGSIGGAGAWAMGLELARELRAGLVVEVWSSALIGQSAAMLSKARAMGVPTQILCPEESLAASARARIPWAEVVTAPWGVRVPQEERRILADLTTPAVALIADGVEIRTLQAVMEGASRVGSGIATDSASASPQGLMLFVGAEDRAAPIVWKLARKLRMLDRTTLVPEMEGHRDPVLAMDLLVVPGGSGVQRTFVLDAMAAGLAVLSGGDTMIPYLNDDRIVARVNRPADASCWAEALTELISHPDRARAIGLASKAWVRAERSASGYVAVVLKTYDKVAARVHAVDDRGATGSAA